MTTNFVIKNTSNEDQNAGKLLITIYDKNATDGVSLVHEQHLIGPSQETPSLYVHQGFTVTVDEYFE